MRGTITVPLGRIPARRSRCTPGRRSGRGNTAGKRRRVPPGSGDRCRSRFGARRTVSCVDGSSAGDCDTCAVRVPCGAVCAPAPAASSEKTPAEATDIAKVLIRIVTPIQTRCRPYGLRLPRRRQLRGGPISGRRHRGKPGRFAWAGSPGKRLVWWFKSSFGVAASSSRELLNQNHTRIIDF